MIPDTKSTHPEPGNINKRIPAWISVCWEPLGAAPFRYARFLGLLGLGSALLTTASPVMAASREGAFTFSSYAGGQGFPFGGDTHYDWDLVWGVRAGYNFTANLGVEVVFGQNKTTHDPEQQFCTIREYVADLRYNFTPEKKLVPYVAAGFGVFDVKFDDDWNRYPHDPLSDHTSAYFNYGGGVEYALTDWLALRADLRHGIMLDSGDNVLTGTLGFTVQF